MHIYLVLVNFRGVSLRSLEKYLAINRPISHSIDYLPTSQLAPNFKSITETVALTTKSVTVASVAISSQVPIAAKPNRTDPVDLVGWVINICSTEVIINRGIAPDCMGRFARYPSTNLFIEDFWACLDVHVCIQHRG
jgi:hypothetical protein